MNAELFTIFLGFLEGFTLILSPCILPILPIILAGSLTGSKKRPFGIIVGFTGMFALFAFFSRQLVQYFAFDLNLVRQFSYGFLILLGIIMLSSYLTEKFSKITQKLANLSAAFSFLNHSKRGFYSGFLIGSLVALIWTPCAGPILAAVIVQTVIQQTNLISFFTLLAFALGAAIPMLIIALYGRKIIDAFSIFQVRVGLFRKLLGVLIITSVIYMLYQENNFVPSSITQTTIKTSQALENGLWRPYSVPQIDNNGIWINSSPLELAKLNDKVVLIDFWTYSCINCIRTLPYLKNWYKNYHHKGLVIIGVHTPEFDFEKKIDNVKNAVQRYGIVYPVVIDNQFITWRNFANRYWPAHYLINKKGKVVYEHFGEGNYEVTENNIRYLLGIKEIGLTPQRSSEPYSYNQTAETYLGYARADLNLSPSPLIRDKATHYHFPKELIQHAWGLQGEWQVRADKITALKANAALKIHFNARKVFVVMGSNRQKPIKVNLLLNGKKLINDSIWVDKHTLYKIVEQQHTKDAILQLTTNEPGLEVYTFTFGS